MMLHVFSLGIKNLPFSLELRRRFRPAMGQVGERNALSELIASAFRSGVPDEPEVRVVGVDGVDAPDTLAFHATQDGKEIVLTYTTDIAGSDAIVCISQR